MTREEELKHEQLLHEARIKMQVELFSDPKSKTECKNSKVFSHGIAKSPKLVIVKFGGFFTDWQKFKFGVNFLKRLTKVRYHP